MSINNILRNLLIVILATYVSLAGGETTSREYYIVKINGVPMTRSAAETVFRIISDNGKITMHAYDNAKKINIELSAIEKDMDIHIYDPFVTKIVKLYDNCLDANTPGLYASDYRKCVFYKPENVYMCFDKEDKALISLMILNGITRLELLNEK